MPAADAASPLHQPVLPDTIGKMMKDFQLEIKKSKPWRKVQRSSNQREMSEGKRRRTTGGDEEQRSPSAAAAADNSTTADASALDWKIERYFFCANTIVHDR
jgi:hypothetical protein